MKNNEIISDEDIKKLLKLIQLIDPEKKVFSSVSYDDNEQNNSNKEENEHKK